LIEAAIDAGDERFPGFDAWDTQFPVDPHSDYRFEEPLEISAALGRAVGVSHGGLEIADVRVDFREMRETFLQDCVALEFVEFFEDERLRKIQTVLRVGFADGFFRVAVANARASADAIENDFVTNPVFSQDAGLDFAGRGELVVIGL